MSKNVEMKVEGETLTITIDLSKNYGPSSTGKSLIIASTEGNTQPDPAKHQGIFIGVNVYKKHQ